MPARSAISRMEVMGGAITARVGAALCSSAGWIKETMAVATGVDFITPRALEVRDLVRPGFAVIFYAFWIRFLFTLGHDCGSGFAVQGIRGRDCPIRQAVVHLVNLAPLAVAMYAINRAGQDKSA